MQVSGSVRLILVVGGNGHQAKRGGTDEFSHDTPRSMVSDAQHPLLPYINAGEVAANRFRDHRRNSQRHCLKFPEPFRAARQ
jgi:hypothetical protein